MNKKKQIALVFGITNDWAFTTGTILLGLQKYKLRCNYDVIIYHQNLSDKNKKLLNKIHSCFFIDYKSGLLDPKKFLRVSELAFSRYKCFGLLDIYKKVIWLDSDILIKGNIDNLIEKYNQGMVMFKHKNIPISVSFSSPVLGFDMKKDCFNTGILLLNSDLKNYRKLEAWCYKKTNQWSTYINSDQAIINLLIQQFNLPVFELDEKYNCYPNRERQNTIIVHPWGNAKFWNGYFHPLWNEYFSQWKKLGGEGPSYSFRKKIGEFIKRFKFT